MLIEVTQEHIDKGRRFQCGSCPVALAIQDKLQSPKLTTSVGTVWASILKQVEEGAVYVNRLDLPREAIDLIHQFDRGNEVSPISFELPLEEVIGQ